ncbi:MAG: hypothetical protein NVS9B13_07550 [Candidatus Acidiferrum sp.]
MTNFESVLTGSYDYLLVSLSVFIAILASYSALDLARRVTSARGMARLLWLLGGATGMGMGIWSMHYIGMLAFRLPIPVQYDWPTVLLSLIAAIVASGSALFVVSRNSMGIFRAMMGSIFMGGGIAGMHYTGMAAMRLAATCSYSPAIVALSVFLAIVISLVALFLTFYFREDGSVWNQKKILSAVLMGAAITAMHYTAMAAATFRPIPFPHEKLSHAVSVSWLSVVGICIITFLVLGTVLQANLRLDSLSSTRQLTARYFLSLGAVSLLAIAGTALVEHQGGQSGIDGRVVNIAGRQRMLSQVIVKDALLLTRTKDANDRQSLVEDLRRTELLWEDSHAALKNGNHSSGPPGPNSAETRKMFAAIDPDFAAMVAATQTLLAKFSTNVKSQDVTAEVNAIVAHEGPYLRTMNEIVFQYDREATEREGRKSQLQFGLLLSILGVLLLQGLMVQRPALSKIQQSISDLILAKQELRRKATFVELMQLIAVAANEATCVDTALQFTLDRICEHTGWPVGHVSFCPAETGGKMIPSTLWHFDDASKFATFRQVTEGTPLAMGAGLSGRIAQSGKPAWIADINLDTNFPSSQTATDLGVKGAFGFPVLSQGKVVAVVEFFSNNIEKPDKELLEVMSSAGAQLGQVAARTQAQRELTRKAEELACSNAEKDDLLESAARFRIVAEAASDAIVAMNSESKILFVNPAAERIFGYQRAEMLGASLTMLMPPQLREVHKAGLSRYLATGQKRLNWANVQVPGRHKSGAEVPIEISFGEFIADGRRMFAAVIRDITERKRTELELTRRTKELSRSNEELEQFAYVASHDLQEPLRMVASYLQLLARRYQGKFDAEADEFIGFAVDGAKRMQTMIQDLLSYSRVTSKAHSLELTDVKAACDVALRDLEKAIGECNAEVSVESLPMVPADAIQLTQLFQNLIGNALKYRNKRKPEIRVAATQSGEQWIFSVKDNGIGIEPQYSERIFQMFQRLHTRREYSGTGIGLAICRKIVERHGGKIWVESEPGNGSTFLFTIPLAGGKHA